MKGTGYQAWGGNFAGQFVLHPAAFILSRHPSLRLDPGFLPAAHVAVGYPRVVPER